MAPLLIPRTATTRQFGHQDPFTAEIKCTYIEEQGVVDRQRQLYMAKVSGAVAEVLQASRTDFFGVRGSQGQVVETIYSRIAHVIQVLRVCYGFYTQFPEVERKE